VELVGVETPFQVALPQNVTDGVAFLVADAKRAVARAVSEVGAVVIRC
jgi:hypothetical protein